MHNSVVSIDSKPHHTQTRQTLGQDQLCLTQATSRYQDSSWTLRNQGETNICAQTSRIQLERLAFSQKQFKYPITDEQQRRREASYLETSCLNLHPFQSKSSQPPHPLFRSQKLKGSTATSYLPTPKVKCAYSLEKSIKKRRRTKNSTKEGLTFISWLTSNLSSRRTL